MMKLPTKSVIAFDPGKSTGVVEVMDGKLWENDTYEYEVIQAGAPKAFLFRMKDKDHVVVEDFHIHEGGPRTNDLWWPVKVITLLELEANRAGRTLERQNVADVKAFADNELLKQHGWWGDLKDDHQRDAARHALFRLYQEVK